MIYFFAFKGWVTPPKNLNVCHDLFALILFLTIEVNGVLFCRRWSKFWNMIKVFIFLLFDLHLPAQLMQAEEKGSGAVSWDVYASYIKAAGGLLAFIVNILLFLFTTGSIAFSNWWLSHWIKEGSGVSRVAFRLLSPLHITNLQQLVLMPSRNEHQSRN